jgi:hypothetical protein
MSLPHNQQNCIYALHPFLAIPHPKLGQATEFAEITRFETPYALISKTTTILSAFAKPSGKVVHCGIGDHVCNPS